jgi:hypothetical protein
MGLFDLIQDATVENSHTNYFQTYEYPYIYIIRHVYRDYDFGGSDDDFLSFYDE